jgi:hypothetical protein
MSEGGSNVGDTRIADMKFDGETETARGKFPLAAVAGALVVAGALGYAAYRMQKARVEAAGLEKGKTAPVDDADDGLMPTDAAYDVYDEDDDDDYGAAAHGGHHGGAGARHGITEAPLDPVAQPVHAHAAEPSQADDITPEEAAAHFLAQDGLVEPEDALVSTIEAVRGATPPPASPSPPIAPMMLQDVHGGVPAGSRGADGKAILDAAERKRLEDDPNFMFAGMSG